MFIGLGGVGSRIVDRISRRVQGLPNWETQLRPLTLFVSIDTNELDQHKLLNIPDGNRINIASFDKSKVIEGFRRSEELQALQWLDQAYEPRPGFKPGAGQIRVESRLGFFYHSPTVAKRLKELVSSALSPGITWRQASPPKFNVYIFCTLAGGTGSGSFLSAAYLIESIIRERHWQPRVIGNLLLSTLMLEKVGPELHTDIHANTYAALKEIEHLNKLDYEQVKRSGRRSEPYPYFRDDSARAVAKESQVQSVERRPFFLSFLFDRPAHISLADPAAAIADAAYLQVFTPLIDNLASEIDNYEKHLEDLTRFPGALRDVGLGYTKNFGAFGAVVMLLPARDLLEYCAMRFAAQAIRSLITFGTDPRAPADDRARALARLAVNYSDPRFLRMADEARDAEINRAFIASVQELARQDEREELPDGVWARLVESTDEGRVTGTDESGQTVRGMSALSQVETRLQEGRRALIGRVGIRQRPFNFPAEGVNQYADYVDKLKEDIRLARALVNEGVKGLEMEALEGEAITALRLDPIGERYLVLRLHERVANRLIPAAEQDLKTAQQRDIENPAVLERLERENYEKLKDTAQQRSFFKKDQAFLETRDEAWEYYKAAKTAAEKTLEAEVRLRQLRALGTYLEQRARQYARLATRMDSLVSELEREAERLRNGQTAIDPGYALCVEVLQSLDEPRRRLWDGAYQKLYIEGAEYMSTFDRKVLSRTISHELEPTIGPDGKVAPKTIDQLVADLRRALLDLGRERLRPRIFGSTAEPGLDIMRGLDLEARIELAAGPNADTTPSDDALAGYRDKKFRALAQLAGVFARVQTAEAGAVDDGVTVNRTRQVIMGGSPGEDSAARQAFVRRAVDVLAGGGRQVQEHYWVDPRLIIVHDVELPIPAYYLDAVVGEIEKAYMRTAANEQRSYHLHTAYKWEKSLPNLNPRGSEVTVGWSLLRLADGLIGGVIKRADGTWVWQEDTGESRALGATLSAVLYRLGEYHHKEDLAKAFTASIDAALTQLGPEEARAKRASLLEQIGKILKSIDLREMQGTVTLDDGLDKPILRTLRQQLEREPVKTATAGPADPYAGFEL